MDTAMCSTVITLALKRVASFTPAEEAFTSRSTQTTDNKSVPAQVLITITVFTTAAHLS
jgi:hypothetical protein